MKILYVIPWLYRGGAEKLVLETCIELNKRNGITTKIITFKKDNTYKSLSDHVDWQIIPSSIKLSLFKKNKYYIDELSEFIFDFQPDIIHTHLWEAEIITRNIDYSKAVWFSHFHDNMKQLRKKLFRLNKKDVTDLYEKNLMLKRHKKINNNFICISKDTLQYAESVLPEHFHKKIHLLNNAINTKHFKNNTTTFKDKIRLINVGSLYPKKNQILAIKVLQKLLLKGFDAELTLLGDGPEKDNLLSFSKKVGVHHKLNFMGFVNNVNEYMLESNIYLHTANYEPFGLVLIEAMASGLPVVTLDGKGNRDFIEHGLNGYIFKEENPTLFAEQIIELFKNQELYNNISMNGQNTAVGYDIKNYVTKLLEIYKASMASIN